MKAHCEGIRRVGEPTVGKLPGEDYRLANVRVETPREVVEKANQ